MERQHEYEIRNCIADAIKEDVERVFKEVYGKLGTSFINKFLFPLTALELNYKRKSEESIMVGLGASDELLLLVNPLREAVFWFIKRILSEERRIKPQLGNVIINETEETAFVEFVLQIHDEYKRGEQIREIRDCSSKVKLGLESENVFSFYFPRVSELYQKEMLYYYGMDDSLNTEKERQLFEQCEMYLINKCKMTDMVENPGQLFLTYNLLNHMENKIDTQYMDLCKKRILSDLNKISTSSIKSQYKTGEQLIGSKDELATFLALLYYLSRLCMQRYMLASATTIGQEKYYCNYTMPELISLGKQVGLESNVVKRYVDYFSINPNIQYGNFTEFPLLKFKEMVIWIPSSIVLNDFQFSIVNGHYYKDIIFENKDETVSQSIVDYIVNHAKKYSNVIYNENYCYSVPDELYKGKPFNSDIDVAIYDKTNKKLLVIECKWKENVFQNTENYVRIEDAFKKIYEGQLEKHEAYLNRTKANITKLFSNRIDFETEGEIDILYLFVDKRIQFHDNDRNRHAIPIFMLAYLFEKHEISGNISFEEVFKEIRQMESKVEFERIRLKKPVTIGEITVV